MSRSKVVLGLVAGVTLVAVLACHEVPSRQEAVAAPDYAAQLAPATEAFIEGWNTMQYDSVDPVMSNQFRRRAPDQDVDGVVAMKEFIGQVHTTYPDFHIVIDEALYGENLAIVVWTVTGTNTGEGAFPPTGKSVKVTGATMLRFADDKIVEEVVFYDTATVTKQLGLEAVPHTTE